MKYPAAFILAVFGLLLSLAADASEPVQVKTVVVTNDVGHSPTHIIQFTPPDSPHMTCVMYRVGLNADAPMQCFPKKQPDKD